MDEPTPIHIMMATLPIMTLFFLFILGAFAIWRRGQNAAMAHRERLAMIEKGMVPPPEIAPHADRTLVETRRPASERFRSMGVTTIGVGFALMMIISVAGDSPQSGIGIGGAIAILGFAMVVNAYLGRGRSEGPHSAERVRLTAPQREEPPAL